MGGKKSRRKKAAQVTVTTTSDEGQTEDGASTSTSGDKGNASKSEGAANKKKGKPKISNAKTVAIRLVDLPKLTKADIMCPICWSTLFEPTTLPCNHSLCEKCFRRHVDETSLCCPVCRMRLSIWARKFMKQASLIDEALWERIKKEFSRIVQAKMNGEDSQNILDDEEDANRSADFSISLVEDEERRPPVIDGIICKESGMIKEELQMMMKQHEKDMEMERLREETASAGLIKQLQEENAEVPPPNNEEEDFLLAKKLQEEFEEEERRQRRKETRKSVPRNLMNDWASASSSKDLTPARRLSTASQSQAKSTPSQSSKKSTPSSSALRKSVSNSARRQSQSSSQNNKGSAIRIQSNKSKSLSLPSSQGASRASQDLMSRFLSSQNPETPPNVPSSTTTDDATNQPCCSKSIMDHDVRYSAFSPTKPTFSMRVFVPSESLAIPISTPPDTGNTDTVARIATLDDVSDSGSTKTPDSINSEVDRHFRPIRGAPKTPPRRRQDGTFLPDPKLIRTTPVKPSFSVNISAYICSPLKLGSTSEQEQGKIPCATVLEKRISNDSGRASDDSRSPDVDTTGITTPPNHIEASSTVTAYQSERTGSISEDYRVTPEDNGPENSKKRNFFSEDDCKASSSSDTKKIKMEPIAVAEEPKPSTSSFSWMSIKEEQVSPGGSQCDVKKEIKEEANPDVKVKTEPLRFDLACSQGIITIDEEDDEYTEMEKQALEAFRLKAEQEAKDRALALKLQKDLDREERAQPRRTRDKYSLRSWLNK